MEQTFELDQEELDKLDTICKAVHISDGETNLVLYAYRTIKMRGSARKVDIVHFSSVGIPMYMALGEVKKITTSDVT